jgi:hypothetical protein
MSVTGAQPTERDLLFQQVEKLASSFVLKGSESLCRLLRYLAQHGADHPTTALKEYQIATELFGRPAGFDPKLDATVRVQTGRLRLKLAEYYAREGVDDPWVLEFPRGSYTLSIHPRTASAGAPVQKSAETAGPPPRDATIAVWALSAVCLGLLGTVIYLAGRPVAASPFTARRAPEALRVFWRGFTDGPIPPLVVFSNAAFVGRPETGIRYFDAARDSRDRILDHYTGVGEVLGIHELDRTFSLLRQDIRVKRGWLLSLDDVTSSDVIFVGSPSENLALRDIPGTREFVFQVADDGARKGDLEIVNIHPALGEAARFMASPSVPVTEDYAVIAAFPGASSGQWVVTLAGITTLGTQAAVEYVCSEQSVRGLLARAGVSSAGFVNPFEALVKVKVSRGVPVNSELVGLHRRETAAAH